MKEKVRNIVVTPNQDYAIWSPNLENIVRDTTLNVEAGCVALYLVNGMLKSINPPGRWVIKSKDEDKSQSKLQLICANTDKTFDICCGVGMIPFKDEDLNLETTVGAHGECKIRITQPWALYNALGHSDITADEIDSYMKLKLSEIMTARLAEVLQHYDYNNIMTQQSVIASDLGKKFSQHLNEIGIEVVGFSLAGIMFSEDYQNKRKEYFENQNRRKAEKEEQRAKAREQRAEIDNILAVANAARGLSSAPVQSNAAPNPPQVHSVDNSLNQPVKYCSRCGTKMAKTADFCPGCGKKAN